MGTAAERAAEVIDWAGREWLERRRNPYNPPEPLTAAKVAALMADPDLLVDLAIEAGGLDALIQAMASDSYPDGDLWDALAALAKKVPRD